MQTDSLSGPRSDAPRSSRLRLITEGVTGDVRDRTAVRKYSIFLPEELAESIGARAGSGSFSAYVREALEYRLAMENLGEIVAEFNRGNDPITAIEVDTVRAALREARPDPAVGDRR